jgi:hypothetical protein
MPLQKQALNIPFGQGIDTKTDPNQVQLGKFLNLSNAVFNSAGLLQKRNGFRILPNSPSTETTTLSIQNENLVAIGSVLQSYATSTQQWITKGDYQEVSLEVDHLVRSTNSQSACDMVVAANNACCTVYLDSTGAYFYTVSDAVTGEVIVPAVQLPSGATIAKVGNLGNSFIVTFFRQVGVIRKLQYIAIPSFQPQSPLPVADLATDVNSLTDGYDILSANSRLYYAYSSSFSGGTVKVSFLDQSLFTNIFQVIPGDTAQLVSISTDATNGNIYVTFKAPSGDVYNAIYDASLSILPTGAKTLVLTGFTVNHLTSAAYSGVNNIFYQITNTYSYSSTRTDYILTNTITETGVVSSSQVLVRSVGLASKAFIYKNYPYFLANYAGSLQPTYFLINHLGLVVSKLAYGNGMRYASTQVLPSVTFGTQNGVANVRVAYLFTTLLAPVNKNIDSNNGSNIYSQTGINIAQFYFNSGALTTSEITGSLHITGGFLWQFDGSVPVEHNFFLYPEDIGASPAIAGGGLSSQPYYYQVTYEWTDADGNLHRSAPSLPLSVDLTNVSATPVSFTGTWSLNGTTMTVSSTAGLRIGQVITDTTTGTNLAPNTIITDIGTGSITFDPPAPAAAVGDTVQTVDTNSITLNIPTLRLTYKKVPNNARIVIYRWSLAQQIFYQITSIPLPINNNSSVDSIAYVDNLNDAEIQGNLILYTTGGVYENIGAPACKNSTLYRARLWFVDAENPNVLWYSKPVVQGEPVEFTDLQTLYIAPTIGVQGSTGPVTALSSMDDKLIIFKENAIYYLNGNGPDVTGANNDYSDPILINSTVGCSNQQSIVFTPSGLMFQSNKGIWVLGRDLNTSYIGAPVEAYNNYRVISCVSVPNTNQIRLALSNNVMLMYDYYYNQWGTFSGLNSRSAIIFNNKHTFINTFNQVFEETPNLYLDGSRAVLMSFTTAWAKLADLQGYQRAYFFYLLGNYKSPHTLSVNIAFDYDPAFRQSSKIFPINYNPPYGNDSPYGSQSVYGGPSSVEQWRVFLANQRCQSMQITVQENYDPSYGAQAGAGLTLSGINFVLGVKRGYTTLRPSLSVG